MSSAYATAFGRVMGYIACGASARELEAIRIATTERLAEIKASDNFTYTLKKSCTPGLKLVKVVQNAQERPLRHIKSNLRIICQRFYTKDKTFEQVLQEGLAQGDILRGYTVEIAQLYVAIQIHYEYFDICTRRGFEILDKHCTGIHNLEIPQYSLIGSLNLMENLVADHRLSDAIRETIDPLINDYKDIRADVSDIMDESMDLFNRLPAETRSEISVRGPEFRPERFPPQRSIRTCIGLGLVLFKGKVVERSDLPSPRGRKRSLGEISRISMPESLDSNLTQVPDDYRDRLLAADSTWSLYENQIRSQGLGIGPLWTDDSDFHDAMDRKRRKLEAVESVSLIKGMNKLQTTSESAIVDEPCSSSTTTDSIPAGRIVLPRWHNFTTDDTPKTGEEDQPED